MEKVTIDYGRLCLELQKQGKTKADLSRDMAKNKNFVGLMEKNPDQPAEVERLMCLLLGLEQGSLIKQEDKTGSQVEVRILENLHKEMREIHQAVAEYGELLEKIWSKVHANTLQLEKVNINCDIRDMFQDEQGDRDRYGGRTRVHKYRDNYYSGQSDWRTGSDRRIADRGV